MVVLSPGEDLSVAEIRADAHAVLFEFISEDHLTSPLSSSPDHRYDFFDRADCDMEHDISPDLLPIAPAEERKSPFVKHSPEAKYYAFEDPDVPDPVFPASLSTASFATDERGFESDAPQYVRRSMLEKRKGGSRRPRVSRCSLSIRAPGSAEREVIQVEEVPVACKRLRISHGSRNFSRSLELPPIMLTARRKRSTTTRNQTECRDAATDFLPDAPFSTTPCPSNAPTDFSPDPSHPTAPSSTTACVPTPTAPDVVPFKNVSDNMIDPELLNECIGLKSFFVSVPPSRLEEDLAPHTEKRIPVITIKKEPSRRSERPAKATPQSAPVQKQIRYGARKTMDFKTFSRTRLADTTCDAPPEQIWARHPTWKLVKQVPRGPPIMSIGGVHYTVL